MTNWLRTALLGLLLVGSTALRAAPADPGPRNGPHVDAALQLVRASSAGNILRIDAEVAADLASRVSEDVPVELKAAIRDTLSESFSIPRLEGKLAMRIAAGIDRSEIERVTRWWTSGPGRAVATAEAIAYADAVGDGQFAAVHRDPYHRDADSRQVSSVDDVKRTLSASPFVDHLQPMVSHGAAARSCLDALVASLTGCMPDGPPDQVISNTAAATVSLGDAAQKEFRSVPTPDLNAYGDFLHNEQDKRAVFMVISQLQALDQQAWTEAQRLVVESVDAYARARYATGRPELLRQIHGQIEMGEIRPGTDVMLSLMRRAAPKDAQVLVELAHLTLRQSPNLAGAAIDPGVPVIAAPALESIQRLVDRALSLDPGNSEGQLLAGFTAYLRRDFDRSIALLTNAQGSGSVDGWLHVVLGDALWAKGYGSGEPDPSLLNQAVTQYQTALATPLTPRQSRRALYQLGQVYAQLKDIPNARLYLSRYVQAAQGGAKANALVHFSLFLVYYTQDLDEAVKSAREAVQIESGEYTESMLNRALWVRAGLLIEQGQKSRAAADIAEASRAPRDYGALCGDFAMFPATLPGVVALHEAGVLRRDSKAALGLALVRASRYAGIKDIERFLAWGADVNYFSTDEGAPLHSAIMGNNVEGVKALLAHGADPLMRLVDGRLPTATSNGPADPVRETIVGLVTASAEHRSPGSTRPKILLKLNYRYRFKEAFNEFGVRYPPDEDFTYLGECRNANDDTQSCLFFNSPRMPPGSFIPVNFPESKWPEWKNYWQEVGPVDAAGTAQSSK